jgi:GDP-D-mannose dehydratase
MTRTALFTGITGQDGSYLAEIDHLMGNASRVRRELGWQSRVGFEKLVKMMVDADLDRHRRAAGIDARDFEVATSRPAGT